MRTAVAVVGSGIAGTAVAWSLVQRGFEVDVFEKGPAYPYPHRQPFEEQVYLAYHREWRPPAGVQGLTVSGDYPRDLDAERDLRAGGQATRWEAITPRLPPADFATRSRCGHGVDWPLGYDELEPWYVAAERLLGVAGDHRDNPFAGPRSAPYPLPPFALSADDRLLAERLAGRGLVIHTTPQARTRRPWDGRSACLNFGTCAVCPIGARYAPNHHLERAVATGRCRLHTGTSVRRVVRDAGGLRLVVRESGAGGDREHPAGAVVLAAGAVETVRLLLLSADDGGGLGDAAARAGEGFVLHHLWLGRLHYREPLFPGRAGPWTAQSEQFVDPPGRGRHGGVKIELPSRLAHSSDEPIQVWPGRSRTVDGAADGDELVAAMAPMRHWRPITFHAESVPGPGKRVTLSGRRDRWGDPFAHVHYRSDEFDHRTRRFAADLFARFRDASGADDGELAGEGEYYSGFHHLGGCPMGADPATSITDPLGRLHGVPNLVVAGGAVFPGSGTVNPTLTLVALALRSADALAEQLR